MRISAAILLQVRPRPSAATFLPFHLSLVIQPFRAVKCEGLTERRHYMSSVLNNKEFGRQFCNRPPGMKSHRM